MRKDEKYAIFCSKNGKWVKNIDVGRLWFCDEPIYADLALFDLGPAKAWLTNSMKIPEYMHNDCRLIDSNNKISFIADDEFKLLILSCELRKVTISIKIGETVFKKIFDPKV